MVPALVTLPKTDKAPPVVVPPKVIDEPTSITKLPFIPFGPVLEAL